MRPRDRTGRPARALASLARRFDAIAATRAGAEWRYAGGTDAAGNIDTGSAETFLGWVHGVPDGTTEVVVVQSGAEHGAGVIVACRPTAALAAALEAAAAGAGDSFVFCGGTSLVILRAAGTVEIRTRTGVPKALPTLESVAGVLAWLVRQFDPVTGHGHPVPGGPPVTVATPSTGAYLNAPPELAATECLRTH